LFVFLASFFDLRFCVFFIYFFCIFLLTLTKIEKLRKPNYLFYPPYSNFLILVVGGIALVLVWSRFFTRVFYEFLFVVMMVGAGFKTILITENGILGDNTSHSENHT
jgi:cellulose synthase/poly-beta-1,6-N-acetylglucosamine synthase-like glycosyltransferase